MRDISSNARFHECIGMINADSVYYEKCMIAQKFDVGDQEEFADTAELSLQTIARPPYPVCLFQMKESASSTIHWFLVEDLSSEEILNIKIARFGKYDAGFEFPFMWTFVLQKEEGVKLAIAKDCDCEDMMSSEEFKKHCVLEDEYAWTAKAAKYMCHYFSVLACTNVEKQENKPPKFINEKRIKKGKVPFFSYWTLHLKQPERENIGVGRSHASPRLHLRRGHIRRLPNGKSVWVVHCLVGNKSCGIVQKDYLLTRMTA